MKRYEHLDEAMCRELEKLDKKYASEAADMSMQDAELAEVMYHALKCGETYYAMKEAQEDERGYMDERSYRDGRSYARRRESMGRYSGDMGGGYSGHYPMMYPENFGRGFDGGYRY